MTKLITTNDLTQLSKQLENIQENSTILGRNEFLIDGTYLDGNNAEGDFMSIQYLDSGISETIEIDNEGHVYLDNNTNEYAPMYGEDLEDIAKVAKILNAWWNNLPKTNK